MTDPTATIVHLLRHGEVDNPDHVLYGRLPGFHLSALGNEMAQRAADWFADIELAQLRTSPLERTLETLAPIAATRPELDIVIDPNVIEAGNYFEGQIFGPENVALKNPKNWWVLRNPLRPSWGEPYESIVARMKNAVLQTAAEVGPGAQALIVSHQLPIWLLRSSVEGRRLVHDPRTRECTLASITSFTVVDGEIVSVDYAEPSEDLLPAHHIPKGRR